MVRASTFLRTSVGQYVDPPGYGRIIGRLLAAEVVAINI